MPDFARDYDHLMAEYHYCLYPSSIEQWRYWIARGRHGQYDPLACYIIGDHVNAGRVLCEDSGLVPLVVWKIRSDFRRGHWEAIGKGEDDVI